ncbi:orexin/Hypocretin receptor type 1-like [Physella acuta]|uniref:orexin/Hypocretin receptor type 1-like n=1 Tax=Physella acuta TaxID=109671 RepID=UPI0027DB0109|nr:orexin/Hypocretin receptor type 1-like [Physella acuta]
MFSHWLCYFNSAVNPTIYNFMSCNFRREFRIACHICCRRGSTQNTIYEATVYTCPSPSPSSTRRTRLSVSPNVHLRSSELFRGTGHPEVDMYFSGRGAALNPKMRAIMSIL